jgi:hypothetical protein
VDVRLRPDESSRDRRRRSDGRLLRGKDHGLDGGLLRLGDRCGGLGGSSYFRRGLGSRCGRRDRRRRGGRLDGRRTGRRRLEHRRPGVLVRRLLGLRRRAGTRRQQVQRIDVTLVVGCHAHPEVHVRLGVVDHPARTDAADDRGLTDERAAFHADRAKMHERGRVAEGRLDGDRLATVRDRAGERHDPFSRREHRCTGFGADIETAVLPGSVRVCPIEGERTQDRAADRPGPRLR